MPALDHSIIARHAAEHMDALESLEDDWEVSAVVTVVELKRADDAHETEIRVRGSSTQAHTAGLLMAAAKARLGDGR